MIFDKAKTNRKKKIQSQPHARPLVFAVRPGGVAVAYIQHSYICETSFQSTWPPSISRHVLLASDSAASGRPLLSRRHRRYCLLIVVSSSSRRRRSMYVKSRNIPLRARQTMLRNPINLDESSASHPSPFSLSRLILRVDSRGPGYRVILECATIRS